MYIIIVFRRLKEKNKKKEKKDAESEERKSDIDAVQYISRRHGRMSMAADEVSRSNKREGRRIWWRGKIKKKERKKEREEETQRERGRFAEISLFLLASTVISAKLKLPKEVSFASPSTHPLTLTHPNSSFSYLSRTPLWFGVLLTLGTSLPPANQPTNQPRASLMLLLQISGRLLGCLPAGTIGRCVFPSSRLSLVIF